METPFCCSESTLDVCSRLGSMPAAFDVMSSLYLQRSWSFLVIGIAITVMKKAIVTGKRKLCVSPSCFVAIYFHVIPHLPQSTSFPTQLIHIPLVIPVESSSTTGNIEADGNIADPVIPSKQPPFRHRVFIPKNDLFWGLQWILLHVSRPVESPPAWSEVHLSSMLAGV